MNTLLKHVKIVHIIIFKEMEHTDSPLRVRIILWTFSFIKKILKFVPRLIKYHGSI